MSGVDRFVAEDAVDGEVFCGSGLAGESVKDPGGQGGGVGAEAETQAFVFGPGVAVAD